MNAEAFTGSTVKRRESLSGGGPAVSFSDRARARRAYLLGLARVVVETPSVDAEPGDLACRGTWVDLWCGNVGRVRDAKGTLRHFRLASTSYPETLTFGAPVVVSVNRAGRFQVLRADLSETAQMDFLESLQDEQGRSGR